MKLRYPTPCGMEVLAIPTPIMRSPLKALRGIRARRRVSPRCAASADAVTVVTCWRRAPRLGRASIVVASAMLGSNIGPARNGTKVFPGLNILNGCGPTAPRDGPAPYRTHAAIGMIPAPSDRR